MTEKSQDCPKLLPPEISIWNEAHHDMASTLDVELRRACKPTGSELPMLSCYNDAKSDHLRDLLKNAIALLNESKRKESELSKNNCKLKEEKKRMQENEKLFSSELQKLLSCLKMVEPSVATSNEDDPAAIFRAVRKYLNDRKNQEFDNLTKKHMLLEGEKNKLYEELNALNAVLEWEKIEVCTAEKLERCLQESKEIRKVLETTKMKFERANQEASIAKDQANKRLLELKNSNNNLKAAKRSLASHQERALKLDKIIDEMKEVISHISFPTEIVSRDITHKVSWLAEEHKKTCEDLGSTKDFLEQAHSTTVTAQKELEKCLLERKTITEDLDTTKLSLEQQILESSRELGAMKVNLEQAKTELDECRTELRAAELNVKRLDAIKRVTSAIEFPKETQPVDTLMKVELLADYYKNNFIDSIIGWNSEERKMLISNMKDKIVDELSETIRVLVEEAVEEAIGAEDPDPEASSSELMADTAHTEAMQNGRGATTNEQDSTHVEQDSCSGERVVVEPGKAKPEASSSATVAYASEVTSCWKHPIYYVPHQQFEIGTPVAMHQQHQAQIQASGL